MGRPALQGCRVPPAVNAGSRSAILHGSDPQRVRGHDVVSAGAQSRSRSDPQSLSCLRSRGTFGACHPCTAGLRERAGSSCLYIAFYSPDSRVASLRRREGLRLGFVDGSDFRRDPFNLIHEGPPSFARIIDLFVSPSIMDEIPPFSAK
jgi:hypothetical protein